MSYNFSVVFEAKDMLSRSLINITKQLKRIKMESIQAKSSLNRVFSEPISTTGLQGFEREFGKTMTNVNKLAGARGKGILDRLTTSIVPLTAATAGLGAAVGFPIKKAMEYENAMLEIRRALSLTDSQANTLKDALMNLRGGTFREFSMIAADVAKSGVTDLKELVSITNVLNKSSKAIGMDVEATQTAISKVLNLNDLKVTGSTVLDVANKLANLENELTNVKATELSDVWKRTSKSMKNLNLDIVDQAAIAGTLLSRGISPELAASELNMFYNRLSDAQKKLGIDFRTMIQKGGLEGFRETIKIFSKLNPGQLIDVLGSEGKKMIETLGTTGGFDTLDKAIKASLNSAGAVDREWKEYIKTFSSQMSVFNKGIENMLSVVGGPAMSVLGPFLGALGGFLTNITNLAKEYPMLTQVLSYSLLTITAVTAALLGTALSVKVFRISTGFLNNNLLRLNIVSKITTFTMTKMRAGFVLFQAAVVSSKANILLFLGSLKRLFIAMITNPVGVLKASLIGLRIVIITLNSTMLLGLSNLKRLFIMMITNPVGVLTAALGALRTAMFFVNTVMAANPIGLVIIGIAALVAAILYLIYNWKSLSLTLLGLYNKYIAPVISGIRYGFSYVFDWIGDKINKFIMSWRKMVLFITDNPIGKKVFGTLGFDVENYKKQTEELQKEYAKASEEFKNKTFKVDAAVSEEDFKKSGFYKGMDSLSEGMHSLTKKAGGIKDSIMSGATSMFSGPSEKDILESLKTNELKNPNIQKTISKKTEEMTKKTKVQLDINLERGLTGNLKTREKRESLSTNIRTAGY